MVLPVVKLTPPMPVHRFFHIRKRDGTLHANKAVGSFPMALSVVVDGATWHLFDVEFLAEGKSFSFFLYALSFEDADKRVEAICKTAKVSGQIEDWVPA